MAVTSRSDPPPAGVPGHDLERRIRALGIDEPAVAWVCSRVSTYFPAMARRLGVDPVQAQDRFRLELLAAETRCAACEHTGRCRRFLAAAGDADPAPTFCPNAQLFCAMAQMTLCSLSGRPSSSLAKPRGARSSVR